jgi:hypothetical protein
MESDFRRRLPAPENLYSGFRVPPGIRQRLGAGVPSTQHPRSPSRPAKCPRALPLAITLDIDLFIIRTRQKDQI